jgi:hypothetical protein
MAITTPARVRNRIQAIETDISDDVLTEFIADEQAFVESYAGKTFADTAPGRREHPHAIRVYGPQTG